MNRARELCAWLRDYAETRIRSTLMDERRCMPPYLVMDLGNRGVLGMLAGKAYGGLEFTQPEALAVFEQLGAIDLTLAVFAGIHNGLGIRPIERFGTDALKSDLLPQLAAGRILGAFAMTEHAAGSNARNIEARAIADGDGWRLRGTKIFVGNGSWAGAINVVARRPPEAGGGMCAFTVRAGAPGLRMGAEAMTTGMRAIVQNEIVLDDVPVTRVELLGIEGQGFDVADDMFAVARLGISAIALGGLRRCTQLAYRFASRRTVNTGPLLANAKTREVLSAMIASTAAAEALIRFAGERCDGLAPPPHLAAICKAIVPELLGCAADRATQLLGGRGYIESNLVPLLVRDARLLRIFEGPTETLEHHLGAVYLAAERRPDPRALFAGLEGTQARARVDTWTTRLAAALEGTTGDARVARAQQIKLAAGHVVAWGVLAAVAELGPPDPLATLARQWTAAQLEARAQAVAAAIEQPVLADADLLARAIAGYRDAIGDVEQSLPGEHHELDPMLRRS